MTFNWYKAIGFGVVIWLVMFALISALVGFDITTDTLWIGIGTAAVAGIASYIAALFTKVENMWLALAYGASWVVVGVALDLLISMRFNADIFTQWQYWLGYALVLLAPLADTEVHHLVHHTA